MGNFTFRDALNQFGEEIRNAIRDVPVNDAEFASFVELFAADFDELLSGDNGEAVWRRDRQRVRRLGRYLGTMAEFFAVAHLTDETVGTIHLMRALNVMRPECKLGLALARRSEREGYCRHVQVVIS
jgi:hypothetical protein